MALANIALGYKNSGWFNANPTFVLKLGQHVYLEQTGMFKIGDGATQLQNLALLGASAGSIYWADILGSPSDNADLVAYIQSQVIAQGDFYSSIASSANPAPIVSAPNNLFRVTALSVNATFQTPSGSIYEGVRVFISIKDNGTARALSFNTYYRFSSGVSAPTTTVPGQTLILEFLFNVNDNKLDCILCSSAGGGTGTITGSIGATAGLIPFGSGTADDVDSDAYLFYYKDVNDNYIQMRFLQMGYKSSIGAFIDGTGYGQLSVRAGGARVDLLNSSDMIEFRVAAGLKKVINLTNIESKVTTFAPNVYTNSATPSIAAGVAAGTGPTLSVVGTNMGGVITILTGTGISLPAGILATVTFSGSFAFPNGCSVNPTANDGATTAVMITTYASGTTTTFVIGAAASAVYLPTTTYKINYTVSGY